MSGQIRGLVFDMDGTLVDNMHFHHLAWKKFLSMHGVELSDEAFHQKNVGTIREVIPNFLPKVKDPDLILELGMQKEAVYREIYGPHIQPLKGLGLFLEDAYQREIPIALATAADQRNIDFTLEGLGLRHYFKAITGSEEVRKGKPDPAVYLISAGKLKAEPRHCIAFEDTPAGIRSALDAGMTVVGLATTHTREELKAFPLLTIMDNYDKLRLADLEKLMT